MRNVNNIFHFEINELFEGKWTINITDELSNDRHKVMMRWLKEIKQSNVFIEILSIAISEHQGK